MDNGKFATSVNESAEILKDFGLLKEDRSWNVNKFSLEYMGASRSGDYLKIYDIVIKNFDYTFLLKDESYFQFHKDGNTLGYIFMQNPRRNPNINTFKQKLYGDSDIPEDEHTQFYEFYEQYLSEQSIYNTTAYMRLDCDHRTYTEFLHSLAHLHINVNSEIRIPLNKVLTPLAFCCFVLKHVYYHHWKDFTAKDSFAKFKGKLRESLFDHPSSYWSDEDELNLYLI